MSNSEINRSVLTTTIFRFSPHTQPVRQTALDKIIENAIYLAGDELGATEIQDILLGNGGVSASPGEIADSLLRLVDQGRVERSSQGGKTYKLSSEAAREVQSEQAATRSQQYQIVEDLIAHTGATAEEYASPFMDVLAYIFAGLGEESVQLLRGVARDRDIIDDNAVSRYSDIVAGEHGVDPELLQKTVLDFFASEDPRHNELIWRLAQSFFIAKSIGLDHGGTVLAKETFERAIFYIDTNIAIPALEPAARLHNSFQLVHKAGKQLDIWFRVCKITLDELKGWATYQYGLVKNTFDSIPEEALQRAGSIFLDIYKRKKEVGEYNGIDSLFQSFDSPKDKLECPYDVEDVDSLWFDKNERDPVTQRLTDQVQRASREQRGTEKRESQALHDALLLRWVLHQRKQGYKDAWLLTADTSLPAVNVPDYEGKSLVVTIDALLQWLSPVANINGDSEAFQNVFADLIRQRILPQDRFFTLADFAIFNDLHISVKEMPAEDVAKCVEYIKNNVGTFNLSKPDDRERLSYEIKRFLSDPDRKFKKELQRLEQRNEELSARKDELEKHLDEDAKQIAKLENHLERLEKGIDEKERYYERRLDSIKTEFQQETKKQELKSQGWRRLIGICFLVVVLLIGTGYLAYAFGDPDKNAISRIVSWWGLGVYPAIVVGGCWLGYYFVGVERLQAMELRSKEG